LNSKLELPGLEITLDLSQVFARVQFEAQPARLHPGR
jgi:hypothetical protein